MNIDIDLLTEAFKIMGLGMSGIFIVLFILYLVSLALLKFLPVKTEE